MVYGSSIIFDTLNALTAMCNKWMDFAKNFIKRTIPYLNEEQLMPVYEATSKNSPHVMSEMCLAMSVNDYRDVLENIAVPPFITYGEKSTLYSSKTAEYLS